MKKMMLGLVFFCGMASTAFGNTSIEKFVPVLEPAQPPPQFYIGLTGGYGRTFLSHGIANPFLKGSDFENARSNTFFIGISGEYFFKRFDRRDGFGSLVFKTYYRSCSSANSSFSRTEEKNTGSQTQTVETQYSASFKNSSINFESLYSTYLFSSPFSITVGPGFGFIVNEELLKRAEIVQPSDFTFDENSFEGAYSLEQNSRAAVFKSRNASGFQAYIKVGVQYNLFFGHRNQFQLVPSASYNFGITKPYSSEKFRLSTIDFGVDLRTAF